MYSDVEEGDYSDENEGEQPTQEECVQSILDDAFQPDYHFEARVAARMQTMPAVEESIQRNANIIASIAREMEEASDTDDYSDEDPQPAGGETATAREPQPAGGESVIPAHDLATALAISQARSLERDRASERDLGQRIATLSSALSAESRAQENPQSLDVPAMPIIAAMSQAQSQSSTTAALPIVSVPTQAQPQSQSVNTAALPILAAPTEPGHCDDKSTADSSSGSDVEGQSPKKPKKSKKGKKISKKGKKKSKRGGR